MTYKITPIKKPSKKEELTKQELQHKFLYPSVKSEVEFYTHNSHNSIVIYCIFGFYFLVGDDINKNHYKDFQKIEDTDVYNAYYFDTLQSDESISQTLRNSNTLQISTHNSYDSSDIKVVFAEKGFVTCSKLNLCAKDKFERVLLLYLVVMAYNQKAQVLLQEVSQSHKNKSYEDMIKKRDEIYAFDLNCFFSNPVKQNRQQVYDIWNIIAKVYDTKNKYDEIKSQVIDLVNVIEIQYKEKQEKKLSIILAIVTFTSLISVFKDLKEMMWRKDKFKYVFSNWDLEMNKPC